MDFIKDDKAKKYIKCFKPCEKMDLHLMYPAVDKSATDLMHKMLTFNPNNRISAEEALRDSYFDDIRLEEQEEFDPLTIDLSFIDKYHEGMLDPEDLKQMILDHIYDLSKNYDTDIKQFV